MSKAALLSAFFLVVVEGSLCAASSNELGLGTATVASRGEASIPLTLSSTDEVEGLAAAFEWDGAVGTGKDLVPGAALSGADVVVRRVEATYMVLGVVVDSDGSGIYFIPPGTGTLLATAKIQAAEVDSEKSTDLAFVDSKYASMETGPLLENLVSVGGLSITKEKGLVLKAGKLTVVPGAVSFAYKIEDGSSSASSSCGAARVLLDASDPVEGYEIALSHPAGLDLQQIDVGRAATENGADFTKTEILSEGGTVGVVLDLVEPFQGNKIPPGQGIEIAVFTYCCRSRPAPGNPPVAHALRFVNDVLGSPPKANTVVTAGVAYPPETRDGTFTCTPAAGEICDNGVDDDGDQLVDCDDPDCADFPACLTESSFACGSKNLDAQGRPLPAEGEIGGKAQVCFFYRAPEETIQGLSMSIGTPCELKAVEGSFDVTGTIVEAVKAEYVYHQADVDPADGDGCELVIGILVDQLPPFDGAALPATDVYLALGCIDFSIANDPALAGRCIDVTFQDGLNGRGKVPIRNLISVDNFSKSPKLASCQVCVRGAGNFYRGDCNFSGDSDPKLASQAVDIADAAAAVSYLVGTGPKAFSPPCLDACDCNDDGRIDLADVVCILKYLFELGTFPPAPGPGYRETGLPNPNSVEPSPPGPDPTPDALDCRGTAGAA